MRRAGHRQAGSIPCAGDPACPPGPEGGPRTAGAHEVRGIRVGQDREKLGDVECFAVLVLRARINEMVLRQGSKPEGPRRAKGDTGFERKCAARFTRARTAVSGGAQKERQMLAREERQVGMMRSPSPLLHFKICDERGAGSAHIVQSRPGIGHETRAVIDAVRDAGARRRSQIDLSLRCRVGWR